MTLLSKVAPLLAAVGLGYLAGALRVFRAPADAVVTLNRYALYFAFPLLMFGSLCRDDLAVPTGVGFYAAHGAVFAALVLIVRLAGTAAPRLRGELGTSAMAALFGNVAYLGLPFAASTLGPQWLGLASISAGLHIVLSMLLGPVLLLAWRADGAPQLGLVLRRVARQPLVWAPALGLLARQLPAGPVAAVYAPLAPIGASAGPVALFLLGLYLHLHRRDLWQLTRDVAFPVALKLLVFPALAFAAAFALRGLGAISTPERDVLVLLCGMPTAITTFAIAQELEIGQRGIARAIVASTALALLTLPLLAALLASV